MMKAIGAIYKGNGVCRFTVWAPQHKKMSLTIPALHNDSISMTKDEEGYFYAEVANIEPGLHYYYTTAGNINYPDPASFYQPEGVFGPSAIVDHRYEWSDSHWKNIPFKELIIYELHIGTFTEEGTFDAAITRLDALKETGFNAIELMPVGQFPGKRNWGYDGVFPYAVQHSYGGPEGLQRFVNACHAKGLAVILDVIYNHIGPEGSCLHVYAPYFNDRHTTPWGDAINLDNAWCDGVRNFFCNNALYWLKYFHIDGLRFDAIHEMYDFSAVHFWELLQTSVAELEEQQGKKVHLIAESDWNNPKVVEPIATGGCGFRGQWLDDFHHALYVLLDPDGKRLYEDFGSIEHLAKAYTDGFVCSGEYIRFRHKRFGRSSAGLSADKFIAFAQNHDQIGNRADGKRLSALVSPEKLRIAAAAVFLSPYIPMVFMGEEYGETNPFYYFVDHSDPGLREKVMEGRKKEFDKFEWDTLPPDPNQEATFITSILSWTDRLKPHHKKLLDWYRQLIALRKNHEALKNFERKNIRILLNNKESFVLYRTSEDQKKTLLSLFNLSDKPVSYNCPLGPEWKKILDSSDDSDTNDTKLPETITVPSVEIPPFSVAVYEA